MLVLLYGSGRYVAQPGLADLRVRRDDAITARLADEPVTAGLQDDQISIELEEVTE